MGGSDFAVAAGCAAAAVVAYYVGKERVFEKLFAAKGQGVPKVKTGDKFPMDVVVQHTWKKAYSMGQLVEGCKKFLVITLPGAFTPT